MALTAPGNDRTVSPWWTVAAGLTIGAVAAQIHARAEHLKGRTALVTGGSRGLGLLIAEELAREGCRIAICARDQRELDAARDRIRNLGAEVMALVCDVAQPEEVERTVAEVAREYGAVELLFNCASVIQVGPLAAMTVNDFRLAMEVNFFGCLYSAHAVMPGMIQRRWGRIINIASIGGKVSVPHLLPYNCAKFAVVGLSEGLRAELAQYDVRVTTVVPGLMRTGSPPNALFKGDAAAEWAWFSAGDTLAPLSIGAPRAARRIVRAARRGEAEVTLGVPAKILRIAGGLWPGLTADLFAAVNRILPRADFPTQSRRGMELVAESPRSWLIALIDRAARAYNQYAGSSVPDIEPTRTP